MLFKLWVLLLCVPLSGCYYLQAAQGQLAMTVKRQPIAQVIASPTTEPQVRQRLIEAQAMREFATRVLHLPDNRSYQSYVELDRAFMVWNVFAAPELSLKPVQWCFPIAGCVAYRGYFSESAAARFARKLRARGFDASTGGVAAYSTLGNFDDPIASSMLHWGSAQLANTLFHELAHQVVYVAGDAPFNEAFSTVVADTGLQRWLVSQQRLDDWQRWQVSERRQQDVDKLLLATRQDLARLYAGPSSVAQKRERKLQRLGELKFAYQLLKQQWAAQGIASDGYDRWFDRPLSNADFVALATYQDCVPAFTALLASVDGDLAVFYAQVKLLAAQDKSARQRFCLAIQQ